MAGAAAFRMFLGARACYNSASSYFFDSIASVCRRRLRLLHAPVEAVFFARQTLVYLAQHPIGIGPEGELPAAHRAGPAPSAKPGVPARNVGGATASLAMATLKIPWA